MCCWCAKGPSKTGRLGNLLVLLVCRTANAVEFLVVVRRPGNCFCNCGFKTKHWEHLEMPSLKPGRKSTLVDGNHPFWCEEDDVPYHQPSSRRYSNRTISFSDKERRPSVAVLPTETASTGWMARSTILPLGRAAEWYGLVRRLTHSRQHHFGMVLLVGETGETEGDGRERCRVCSCAGDEIERTNRRRARGHDFPGFDPIFKRFG